MILPKELFDQISFWEHTVQHGRGYHVWDVFTIHFRQWWKRKKVIKIHRVIDTTGCEPGFFHHNVTPSAADLYNQLNDWAIQSWDEKLDSVKQKYEPPKDGSNVIQLKPKPKDIDDE